MTAGLPDDAITAEQIAYRAYRASIKGAYGPGFDLGEWADLTCQSQDAWRAAATALLAEVTAGLPDDAVTAEDVPGDVRVAACEAHARYWHTPLDDEIREATMVVLSAALPALTDANTTRTAEQERERIRQLAIDHDAVFTECNAPCGSAHDLTEGGWLSFADLLGDVAGNPGTPGSTS